MEPIKYDFDYYANVLALGWVSFSHIEDGTITFYATRDKSWLIPEDGDVMPDRESEEEGCITAFVSGQGWTSLLLEQLAFYDHHLMINSEEDETEDTDVSN